MKTCSKCGEAKEEIEYGKDKRKEGRLRPRCKGCENICSKSYQENLRISNPELYREMLAKHATRERTSIHRKEYRKNYNREYDWFITNPTAAKTHRDKWNAITNPKKNEERRLATQLKHIGDEPTDWITE